MEDARQWNHSTIRCVVGAGTSHTNHFRVALSFTRLSRAGADSFSYPAPEIYPHSLRMFLPSGEVVASNATGNSMSFVNSSVNTGGDVLGFDGRFFGPDALDIVVEYARPFLHYAYRAEIIPE